MYAVEILTPDGWAQAPEMKDKTMTKQEAYKLAVTTYGPKLWSHFLGGKEKVRVVNLDDPTED
jgi:hypothetical protein